MRKICFSHLLTIQEIIQSRGLSQNEKYSFSLSDFVNGADSFAIYVVVSMDEKRAELIITAYCSDSTVRSQTLNFAGPKALFVLERLLLLRAPISVNILLRDMSQSGELNYQI